MEYTKNILLQMEKKANTIASEYGCQAFILMQSETEPLMSVGVQGDKRNYGPVIMIRGEYDIQKVKELSTRITNEISGISRVEMEI